jgi:hypothetical protein
VGSEVTKQPLEMASLSFAMTPNSPKRGTKQSQNSNTPIDRTPSILSLRGTKQSQQSIELLLSCHCEARSNLNNRSNSFYSVIARHEAISTIDRTPPILSLRGTKQSPEMASLSFAMTLNSPKRGNKAIP